MTDRRLAPERRVNPSGRVVWRARVVLPDGRRKVIGTYAARGDKCRKGETACCAMHAQDAWYAQQARGPVVGVPTIREYAATWLRAHPRSERTNATNEHRLQVLIGPFTAKQLKREARDQAAGKTPRTGVVIENRPLGDWPLHELRRKHVRLIVDELLSVQGRAAAGAKGLLLVLSAMYEDAIEDYEDVAITNPCGVKVRASDPRVKKAPRAPRVVTWEQMHSLAAAAGAHEAMLRKASDCGLRLGELLGLEAVDVKLSQGACDEALVPCPGIPGAQPCGMTGPHLHVRRSAHDGVVLTGTKRERLRQVFHGGRVVPISPGLYTLLKALPPRIAGPMWPGPSGGVWREDTFRDDVWNPARKVSKVDASPQDFRHSWVTLLRAAGVDPADLASMAGHSIEVGTAVYTHSLGRSADAVRDAVGQ